MYEIYSSKLYKCFSVFSNKVSRLGCAHKRRRVVGSGALCEESFAASLVTTAAVGTMSLLTVERSTPSVDSPTETVSERGQGESRVLLYY